MKSKGQMGKVTQADRDYFKRLGEANTMMNRMTCKPAGTLRNVFDVLSRLELPENIKPDAPYGDTEPHEVYYIKRMKEILNKTGSYHTKK